MYTILPKDFCWRGSPFGPLGNWLEETKAQSGEPEEKQDQDTGDLFFKSTSLTRYPLQVLWLDISSLPHQFKIWQYCTPATEELILGYNLNSPVLLNLPCFYVHYKIYVSMKKLEEKCHSNSDHKYKWSKSWNPEAIGDFAVKFQTFCS